MTFLSKLYNAELKGPRLSRLAMASSGAALLYWAYLVTTTHPRSSKQKVLFLDRKSKDKKSKKRINFNQTLKQLRIILRTIMTFQDVALACGVTVGLILRTLLDLKNIQITTRVESAIITMDPGQLKHTLFSFAIIVPTLAFANNTIKAFTDTLSLRLRYNLSKDLYLKYMTDMTFYQLSNDNEFQNVDQLLTADVDKFCSSIVEVYNNLSKPVLDIVLLVHRMTTSYTGPRSPAVMVGWLAVAGTVLTHIRRPLSSYIIRETQSEGQLRFVLSRLIQNSEEIAFYKGNSKEQDTLMSALDMLKNSLSESIVFKFKIGLVDHIVGRYLSTVIGYIALALPFFSGRHANSSNEERLTQYYISGRMMVKLAESITRVILAGQDLTKLSAYTLRVKSLMDSMDEIHMSTKSLTSANGMHKDGPIIETCDRDNPIIDFQNVTLSTPNGDILVRDLTFTIKPKQSVIIAGPNGSGKSSLFRVLGNLWQVEKGKLIRPGPDQLFYICQKPYMTLGSLRDQLIFPDKKSKVSDEQLIEILQIAELKYLLEREHSLDSLNDWQDVLSGGEKQRLALARLIYHKPQFAILDECTSAVAIDVEQRIYKYLSEDLNCTLLSVTHRVKQLAKFHHLILEFDGKGSFEFKRIVGVV